MRSGVRGWVERKPGRELPPPREVAHLLQGRERDGHVGRIEAPGPRIFDAQGVRLVLVVAAVFQEEDLEAGPGQPGVLGELLADHAADGEADLGQLLLAHLAHGVTGVDVADLVAEDRGQLRFRAHHGQDAAGDVDRASRDGEGVDDRAVEHGEAPGQAGPRALGGQGRAQLADVGLKGRVVVNAVGGGDLRVRLLAELDLLAFGVEHELLLAGDGVHGAGDGRGEKQDEGREFRSGHGDLPFT